MSNSTNFDNLCQNIEADLINKLENLNKDAIEKVDIEIVKKALDFAKHYHEGQFRKSGEPYYTHPVAVAIMVSDCFFSTNAIVTSLLHDVIEDTEATFEMIEEQFGFRVAQMVDRLTRDRPDGTKLSVEEILQNGYQYDDKEVLVIKTLDRLHNLMTLSAKPSEKILKTIEQTLREFIVLSTYLGLQDIEEKICSICLQYMNPLEQEKDSIMPFGSDQELLARVLKNDLLHK